MHEPLFIVVLDPDPQTVEKVKEATQDSQWSPVVLPQTPFFDTVLQNKAAEVIILELETPFEKAFELLSE